MRPAFEWNVKNFTHLQAHPGEEDCMVFSEPFEAGGVNWRIKLFPRGNSAYQGISMCTHMAMYLAVADAKNLPVLNGTRSFVRQRWSVRAACVGCAGGMAILRKLRSCDMEPQDARNGDAEGAGHVLCREVRPPALGLGLLACSRSADRAADALGMHKAQPLLQEGGASCWI